MVRELWIFGYGSLLWRPDFPYVEAEPARLDGWVRRFWQGSTDHRGVPGAPGRVVTLVPAEGAHCWGLAFRVAAREVAPVLEALDHRERGGFERRAFRVSLRASGAGVEAVTYVAGPDNPNYLGPAGPGELAAQIRAARGPSGANREYVLRLAQGLRQLGVQDPHVSDLAAVLDGPTGRIG